MTSSEMVNTKLARLALADIEGFPFERFANDFFGAMLGARFVPLGGVKDGGADGVDEALYEVGRRAGAFYQATVEKDTEGKATRTVRRLREFEREPTILYLVTSEEVRYIDQVENRVGSAMDCAIVIRDASYICSHINDSPETRAAFWQHLYPLTAHLREIARPSIDPPGAYSGKSVVYTFLAEEASRREGDAPLMSAMVDAVILWALEGTDPDRGILRTRPEMMERVRSEIPGIADLAATLMLDRLTTMCRKSYPGGRAVNWHRTEDAYCLPHSTRQRLEQDKLDDENLRLEFKESLAIRAGEAGVSAADAPLAVRVAHAALKSIYEQEGVEFSAFLADEDRLTSEYPTVAHAVRESMIELQIRNSIKQRIGPGVLEMLRRVLYESNETERDYLGRVSGTYALLFSLASHPELSSYFQDMAQSFYLYVGSDVILRAISEDLLPAEGQVTRGALDAARRTGASLVLTEPVLEEVIGHLRACDQEHKHHFLKDDLVPLEIARQAPHILLRAYLYARIKGERRAPKSWQAYVHRVLDYEDLYKECAFGTVASYLLGSFGMSYVSRGELKNLVVEDEYLGLSLDLSESKKDQRLADNDALLCLAVYGRRQQGAEHVRASEFGISTWWLTWERAIMGHTRDLVRRRGSRYVMRPEFLLKFVALSSSSKDAVRTHSSVFASVLGFSLGRRVSPGAFHALMKKYNDAQLLEPARRAAAVGALVDRIKGDLSREYAVGTELPAVDRAHLEN
ncbi:hypothetical protein LFM56_16490 [Cellulomonas iranensis]|uniref:hypothetical protein n=1 Tax=Cellulomonas iranensis TaxID=76862 RepID=UPI001CF2412B|nr:hypothetical protein [Cellulomonas iranensis]UCN14439.1 hypothetical protein LFM56_16490 [Cellulomonas iranensis]